jgi:hypothetical protein
MQPGYVVLTVQQKKMKMSKRILTWMKKVKKKDIMEKVIHNFQIL